MSVKETYIGDGLYARFDGVGVWLRAPREEGDHEVCLEPQAIKEFAMFCKENGLAPFLQRGLK